MVEPWAQEQESTRELSESRSWVPPVSVRGLGQGQGHKPDRFHLVEDRRRISVYTLLFAS